MSRWIFGLYFFMAYCEASYLHPEFTERYYESQKQFPFEDYTICQSGQFLYCIDKDIVNNKVMDGIKTHVKNGIVWEPHLNKYLEKHIRPGSLAIDIGAHIGTLTFQMSQLVGDKGEVICFEPQMKIFQELQKNIELNHIENIKIFRYALGNKQAQVQMNLPAHENEGGTGVGCGGEPVDMVSLDQFHFSNVSLIKIDVEGAEDSVLEGAKETILKNKPVILIEIMGGNIYATAPIHVRKCIDATIAKLKSFGYHVSNIQTHDYIAIPLQ